MSWRLHYNLLSKLLLAFWVTAAQFEAIFYKADCEIIDRYYIDTTYVSEKDKKIVLELQHGSTVIVPFDFGFKEFQITTGRGFERTFIYDGSRLIRVKERVCKSTI